MNIFSENPKDWLDLQNKVAYILNSCGYTVETPKKIRTARGEVEIDVYANDSDISVVCECKYWESNIPQNIIFSFRSVVGDIGANKGIVIAKSGFQSGAYENIRNTNIELKTWEDFSEQCVEKYLKTNIKKLLKMKSRLFRLASHKSEYWKYYDSLDEDKQKEVDILSDDLMSIVCQISPMCFMLQNEEHEEIGWSREYIDEIICNAEKKFGKSFPAYYDYFRYVNNQLKTIVARIEFIYGINIL